MDATAHTVPKDFSVQVRVCEVISLDFREVRSCDNYGRFLDYYFKYCLLTTSFFSPSSLGLPHNYFHPWEWQEECQSVYRDEGRSWHGSLSERGANNISLKISTFYIFYTTLKLKFIFVFLILCFFCKWATSTFCTYILYSKIHMSEHIVFFLTVRHWEIFSLWYLRTGIEYGTNNMELVTFITGFPCVICWHKWLWLDKIAI